LGHFVFFIIRNFGSSLPKKFAANKTKKYDIWTEHNPVKFAVLYDRNLLFLKYTISKIMRKDIVLSRYLKVTFVTMEIIKIVESNLLPIFNSIVRMKA
jgi:hypothetical protein